MKSSPTSRRLLPGLLLAIFFFLLLAGLLEGLARTSRAERLLPYRSHGINYPQFDIKWFVFDEYLAREGGLDVLILGNSNAVTGVDPDVLSDAYATRTGSALRVFNFALNAMPPQGSLGVARVIFETRQPEVLVYVLDVRVFDPGTNNYDRFMLDTPWFRYRAGDWNLPGWAFEHSMALQRYLPYRNWTRANFFESFSEYQEWFNIMEPNGMEIEHHSAGFGRNLTPSNEYYARCMNYYSSRVFDPARLEAMQTLVALGVDQGTQVIVAEMPVYPFTYYCMGGEQEHREFQGTIREAVERAGGTFLPALPDGSIPYEYYADLTHLNINGAAYFSRALGEEISRVLPASGK